MTLASVRFGHRAGLACFALLVIAGVTVGFGCLRRSRFRPTPGAVAPVPVHRHGRGPVGNLLVRLGFTMAQASPYIWAASLGLAGGVRERRTRTAASTIAGLLPRLLRRYSSYRLLLVALRPFGITQSRHRNYTTRCYWR